MSGALTVSENSETQAWDAFVCAHQGHVLQSAAWGELKARFGWSAQRVLLSRAGEPVAGAQILFRRLPFGFRLAYVPRGPVCDPQDTESLGALKRALSQVGRRQGVVALTIEPNWTFSPAVLTADSNPTGGFQPRTTIHVDLTRDLDVILAEMKPKWRYNIRLAERKGVTVREGTAQDISTFYGLMQVTGERDRFAIHSEDYYRSAFDLFRARARLFLAEYEGRPLAAIFVTAFAGEAIYLYGASGNSDRERMPNHALHWAAIRWAKERGCTHYDLWGVPDAAATAAQSGHALPEGLYQFKQGFGGTLVQYSRAFDLVFSRIKYAVYRRAMSLRRGG